MQCVPAALTPRQRRRRFAEKELLERLRHYEGLLRQNNVPFEPLHPETPSEIQYPETHQEDLDVQISLAKAHVDDLATSHKAK